MPHLRTLCVYFLVALSPVMTNTMTEDLDVLVFLPQNNSYLFSYERVAPAIRYAQKRLKADGGQYSGFNFNIQFENSDCLYDAFFTLADRSCGQKPDLILGPVCEYEAAAVVRLASHWNIPVISAGALATGFANKNKEYSHLTRIAPPYVKMAETFTAMFEHFSWKSALLVFEDDREQRNCYFTLEGVYHLMSNYNIESYVLTDDKPLDTDELLRSISDMEVVIMCMGAEKIREIMLAAHKRQMTTGKCIFFNVELFNASSYGKLTSITLNPKLKKKTQSLHEFVSCQVNMFVEGFHDALLLYTIALHEAMKNGYSKKNGTEITSRMWNRTFEGIAGQVSIDANGDRNGDFSLMTMINVEAGTYEVVANYFGVNGTFQLLPAFNTEHFTLKGGDKDHPEKTDKSDTPCGLGVSALTGVIVGAVLGAVILVAFYFFRKNYRITIERRTHGEECDSGKHRQLREDSIRSNFSAA
uniref:Natriuretic peptide receptor 3 n=1 Tax=Haplochromis burtoni TaxID=8153 RepID=A0A3Q3BUI2_HAPBU